MAIKMRRKIREWKRVASMCCAVLIVTNSLVLFPTEAEAADQTLDCPYEVHQHTPDCFDTEGNVICGYADYIVHTHDPEYCYDSEGNLVCPLKEVKIHAHDASCYEEPEVILHTHSDDCYEDILDDNGTVVGQRLICGMLQVEEHQHTDACLAEAENSLTAFLDDDDVATQTGGFNGYVTLSVQNLITGTEPFDGDNNPGNDDSASNQIVRSFDTIKYDMMVTLKARQGQRPNFYNEQFKVDIEMDKKITEATFSTDLLGWMNTWQIEYIDGADEVRAVEDQTGALRYDSNNDGKIDVDDDAATFNAWLSGSTTEKDGKSTAYEMPDNAIVKQRLTGTGHFTDPSFQTGGEGRQTLTLGIRVRNAANESTFQPRINIALAKNPENWGPISNGTSEQSSENDIKLDGDYAGGIYTVTVSSAPLFNLTLKDTDEYVNYLSWFDFTDGKEVTDKKLLAYLEAAGKLDENQDKADPSKYTNDKNDSNVSSLYDVLETEQKNNLSNIRYGRMNAVGVTTSLAAHSAQQELDNPGKGYKGCSLPVGDVTFDLNLGVDVTGHNLTDEIKKEYCALLWDYKPNVGGDWIYSYEDQGHTRSFSLGNNGMMGRNMLSNNIGFSVKGMRVAPAAYRGTDSNTAAAYDSGYWNLTRVNGKDKPLSSASDNGSNGVNVYSFKVSDYDFDFNSYLFPDCFDGEQQGSNQDGMGITDFAFSGGYAQVLYVMPRSRSVAVDLQKNVTVGHLELTTKGSGGLSGDEKELADHEVDAVDNLVTSAVKLYASGKFCTRSSFNTPDAKNHTTGYEKDDSFLGTNFWGEPSWDANAFAGDDVSIVGSAQLTSDSDNYIRALNLLQLFDSTVLSITTEETGDAGKYITGEDIKAAEGSPNSGLLDIYENTYDGHKDKQVTWLFAADPDYKNGYNTNDKGVVSYMNTVRADDLVYSDKLYWNEKDQIYNIVKYDIDGDNDLENLVCIGLMTEIRKCQFKDYVYIRIPVTVADDSDYVNETVCTVSSADAWIDEGSMTDVSWANGTWAKDKNKNTLTDFKTITSAVDDEAGNGYQTGNGAASFVKTEYVDGQLVSGTAIGGPIEGASLLVLGYRASVHIDAEDPRVDYYAPGSDMTWVLSDINTAISVNSTAAAEASRKTALTIPVTISYTGTAAGTAADLCPIVNDGYTMAGIVCEKDEDGKYRTEDYAISTDPSKPTTIVFNYQDELYTCKIYAEKDVKENKVTFHLSDVPVGKALPNIKIKTELNSVLRNNDSIQAAAVISGSGDRRAYSTANGNSSVRTIGIAQITGTSLLKYIEVENADGTNSNETETRGEIGSDIQYKVVFSNSGANRIPTAYFYDNLPYNGDNRETKYTATSQDSTIMKAVDLKSYKLGTEEDTGDFQADVQIYFSTWDDAKLNTLLAGFNGNSDSETDSPNAEAVEAMLQGEGYKDGTKPFQLLIQSKAVYDPDNAGTFYKLKDGDFTTEQPTDATRNQYELKEDGTAQTYLKHAFFHRTYAEEKGWITGYVADEEGNLDEDQPIYAPDTEEFKVNGKICHGGKDAYETFLSTVTGVFVRMENLGPERDVVLRITMGTNGNEAGDYYGNRAYNWNTSGDPIATSIVKTRIYSRGISGQVWYDKDENGVRENGEELLSGVTCTLFRWDETANKYVVCDKDVTGENIEPLVTEDDGAYKFSNLAAGKYLVAFSGNVLSRYGGATLYQPSAVNEDNTNDGVSLRDTPLTENDTTLETAPAGVDSSLYSYVIAYTLDNDQVGPMELAALADINNDTYMDNREHQDLGLVNRLATLTVSKTVSGDGADREKAFTFTVTLDNTSINGKYGDMTFVNGATSFTLKDSESKTTVGLPGGADYAVTESDNDGYTVTIEINGETSDTATGSIPAEGTVTVAFNNDKPGGGGGDPSDTPDDVPKPGDDKLGGGGGDPSDTPDDVSKTGDDTHLGLYLLLALLALAGMGAIGFAASRLRYAGTHKKKRK